MWITSALAGAAIICVLYLYRDRKKKQAIFKRLGVPGPEPQWWYGNMKHLKSKESPLAVISMHHWDKKYGKTFGYFEGPIPVLVTSDFAILKEVFISKFSCFTGRKYFPLQPDPIHSQFVSMFLAQGKRWKRLRTIVNPSFSTSKLKHASTMINEKIDVLLDKFTVKADGSFDIQPFLQQLTIDVIGSAVFGVEIDALYDKPSRILTAVKQMVNQSIIRLEPLIPLPELRFGLFKLITAAPSFVSFPEFVIFEEIEKVIEQRRTQPKRHPPDLLQFLIDAEDTKQIEPLEISIDGSSTATKEDVDFGSGETETHKLAHELSQKKLSTSEIILQGLLFLLAGSDTTSTALSFCVYLLATNPDKQQILFEEIEREGLDGNVTHERVHSLKYLDMVLRETLRLYPIGDLVINRRCTETCTVAGLNIPEGMNVQANVWSIHRDPDLWGPLDPNVFEPERHTEEQVKARHSLAWIPFGIGPRNCIGLRFAMLEAKLLLTRLVKKFRIEACSETETPLQLTESPLIMPKNGVHVNLVPR